MKIPPETPRSRSFTRFTMRVGLPHLGQSVLLVVSMTFLRSAVLAIFICSLLSTLPPGGRAVNKKNFGNISTGWVAAAKNNIRLEFYTMQAGIADAPIAWDHPHARFEVFATSILRQTDPNAATTETACHQP